MAVSENSSRIAKNTLLLYVRMIFTMLVSLYTSRIVLKVLGVTDFGLYNVVGGVVTMLSFLSGALGAASSRFITYELGKGEQGNVKKVFRCSVSIHYILAFILVLLAETLGYWFVANKLVIPEDRLYASMWVYQCSLLTFVISIISIPYNALIIAYEKMSAFAYISIYEVSAKLILVFLLLYIEGDHLIMYAILLLIIQASIRLLYSIYCKRNFEETSSKWLWDSNLSKEMLYYGGWKINGYLAWMGITQGINILLNLFFGPSVNAARAISVQVQAAITQFFSNFQTALNPQITKSYAKGDLNYMHSLLINSSKYSFYLILFISVPLFLNTDYILRIWLGNVPNHTVNFVRLMILICVNDALRNPVSMAVQATGKIKKFQLIEGTILLFVVPVAYIFLKYFHISPEMVFVVYFIFEICTQIVRVVIVYPMIQLSVKVYFEKILYPIFKLMIPVIIVSSIIYIYIPVDNIFSFIASTFITVVSTMLIVYYIGLKFSEREFIKNKFRRFIKNFI